MKMEGRLPTREIGSEASGQRFDFREHALCFARGPTIANVQHVFLTQTRFNNKGDRSDSLSDDAITLYGGRGT